MPLASVLHALMNLGIDENIVMSDYGAVSRASVLSRSLIRDASETLARRLSIKAHDLAHALHEFVTIERLVTLNDWKATRHAPAIMQLAPQAAAPAKHATYR